MPEITSTRSAVITGAANGIGRATAARLADRYRLLLVDRDEAALARVVDELTQSGATVSGQVADVAEATDVQAYVARATELYGGIDAFFNNAGVIGVLARSSTTRKTPSSRSSRSISAEPSSGSSTSFAACTSAAQARS